MLPYDEYLKMSPLLIHFAVSLLGSVLLASENSRRAKWQSRWCKIEEEILYFYSSKEESKFLRKIPLQGTNIESAERSTGKKFTLKIARGNLVLCVFEVRSFISS